MDWNDIFVCFKMLQSKLDAKLIINIDLEHIKGILLMVYNGLGIAGFTAGRIRTAT